MADHIEELAERLTAGMNQRGKANGHANGQEKAPRTLDAVWADDIELDLDEEALVQGLLPRRGVGVLYGESGAGKTFVTLDVAGHTFRNRLVLVR